MDRGNGPTKVGFKTVDRFPPELFVGIAEDC